MAWPDFAWNVRRVGIIHIIVFGCLCLEFSSVVNNRKVVGDMYTFVLLSVEPALRCRVFGNFRMELLMLNCGIECTYTCHPDLVVLFMLASSSFFRTIVLSFFNSQHD